MTESESIIPRIRVSPERKTMQMSQPRELDAKTIPILHAPEPSSPPPLVPGANGESVASRYEIVEKIGVGGMGVVYLARDPQLGRYVAIKRLHQESLSSPSMKRRFLREAKAIAALTHIHIVLLFNRIDKPLNRELECVLVRLDIGRKLRCGKRFRPLVGNELPRARHRFLH